MQQPNILYLHSHDTGRYIQPYGHAVPTPQLQRLAGEGVLFRRAFCAGPTCSPSRAALLTGQCPHSAGMLGLAHRGFSMRDYAQHLIHRLHEIGYTSAKIGIQHIIDWTREKEIGYRHYPQVEKTDTGEPDIAGAVLAFLQDPPGQPFFLSVGFGHSHRENKGFHSPPEGEAPTDPRFVLPPAPLPDTPATRRDMAEFIDDARSLDQRMGRVLAALRENGLDGNTIVICTTDHGIAFPLMKCNLTDHGMGVMLIIRGPEWTGFTGGKACDAMVSHIDLYPTLCELRGIAPPAWLEGRSLLPVLRGEAEEVNEEIFGEVTFHAAFEPMRAVRTQRYKYIRRYGAYSKTVLPNCDESLSKDVLLDLGWAEQEPDREMLYDVILDPNESCNRGSDPDLAGVLDEMRARLDAWMRRTSDPLLTGEFPLQDEAVATVTEGRTPQDAIVAARDVIRLAE